MTTPTTPTTELTLSLLVAGVPDKRIRSIPEVVLVRRWVSSGPGNLGGEGRVRGEQRKGQFTSNLRPRWTIPVTS